MLIWDVDMGMGFRGTYGVWEWETEIECMMRGFFSMGGVAVLIAQPFLL